MKLKTSELIDRFESLSNISHDKTTGRIAMAVMCNIKALEELYKTTLQTISLATNIVTAHTISDKPQGYTYREIIGYMAMLQGCNAVINSDGNLELRWYKDSGYVLDGHKYYQQGVTLTTSKDFIIQKLTCNNTKSGSTEQSQITSGDGATGLSFAKVVHYGKTYN